jgi:hypothetical protein
LAVRGWATFAWQSDYGQFYLIDKDERSFQAPVEITDEIEKQSFFAPTSGLVVYTNDCLQQHVRILVHDVEPKFPAIEMMSGRPWTRVASTKVDFPSRRFSLSSPSSPDPLVSGPFFHLEWPRVRAWIGWKEFQGSRDDSVPVEPDVIEIVLWGDPKNA